jgi:outer membrane protein insertion porin family
MIDRTKLAAIRCGIPFACAFVFALCGISGWGQPTPQAAAGVAAAPGSSSIGGGAAASFDAALQQPPLPEPQAGSLAEWAGLPVLRISFEGVAEARLAPLPGHLAQAEGAPLSPEDVKKSLRQLFSTGLFETIQVEGLRQQDGVALVFRGEPRRFIGTVSVDGAKGATMNTQLESASAARAGHSLYPGQTEPGAGTDAPDAGRERLQ